MREMCVFIQENLLVRCHIRLFLYEVLQLIIGVIWMKVDTNTLQPVDME
jgi:hypothetical protein